MKFDFLTIEGNIGSGKTSLSKKIASDFNGKLILEEFNKKYVIKSIFIEK